MKLITEYILTKLPFDEWNEKIWKGIFSIKSLAEGKTTNIFFYVSAIAQALGNIKESWKEKKDRQEILAFLDSCLVHSFEAMVTTTNKNTRDALSLLCSFLMNYIESFRMTYNLENSKVVLKIYENFKEKEKGG